MGFPTLGHGRYNKRDHILSDHHKAFVSWMPQNCWDWSGRNSVHEEQSLSKKNVISMTQLLSRHKINLSDFLKI